MDQPQIPIHHVLLVLVTGVNVLLELPPNSAVQTALSNCSKKYPRLKSGSSCDE
jgi:hypothetical protein